MHRCGTELNLLGLRQETYEAKKNFRYKNIFLFSIDQGEIKCYDSLSNQIIFTQSMNNKGVSCIIKTEDNQIVSSSARFNHIIQLFMSCKYINILLFFLISFKTKLI